tara:strand:- start:4173 stop:5249 length:1077 start_codon:yes stop_codon:yes gene_type:complete
MEPFVVSALKYRPTRFEEVVGQQAITQTLQNALDTKQLAQSLLFCGPRGVGKTSCARILAQEINSQNRNQSEDFAFNVFELDAASNNLVEDIRKINEQVRIPPQLGTHKVYIIDEVHMLSQSAFNAFLKTLEEPPKHAIFILATTEKNKIIPTILSRCQVYDFKRISVSDIQQHLTKIAIQQELKFEDEALLLIAQKADGSLRDAFSIYDRMVSFTNGNLKTTLVAENLNVLDFDSYFSFVNQFLKHQIPEVLIDFNSLRQKGFDGMQFILGLEEHLRTLLFVKDQKTNGLLELGQGIQDKYEKQSQNINTGWLLEALGVLNQCEISFKSSQNKNLHIELCLLQLASLHFNGEKKKTT